MTRRSDGCGVDSNTEWRERVSVRARAYGGSSTDLVGFVVVLRVVFVHESLLLKSKFLHEEEGGHYEHYIARGGHERIGNGARGHSLHQVVHAKVNPPLLAVEEHGLRGRDIELACAQKPAKGGTE